MREREALEGRSHHRLGAKGRLASQRGNMFGGEGRSDGEKSEVAFKKEEVPEVRTRPFVLRGYR